MEIRSEVLGDVNVNTERRYTQADQQQFSQALKILSDNRFDFFPNTEGGQHNRQLIDEFFQKNRQVSVALENIYRAVEERKLEFVSLTQAATNWYEAAQENPQLANDLAQHLATHGQPGRLVNDGDQLFENLLLLFNEINSRRESANSRTIAAAEDRILHRPDKQLHRVQKPRRTEPMSRAAKEDDGKPFLVSDMVPDGHGGLRSKTPAEQKAEREAREAATSPHTQEHLSATDREWKRMAEEACRYGTHGQQNAIKIEFAKAVQSGAEWRRVYEACQKTVNLYKRGGR